MSYSQRSVDGRFVRTMVELWDGGVGTFTVTYVAGSNQRFPEDVASVWIQIPANNLRDHCPAQWPVSEPNAGGHQWSISGTLDQPTLAPSLHAVDIWHGWFKAGRLESC